MKGKKVKSIGVKLIEIERESIKDLEMVNKANAAICYAADWDKVLDVTEKVSQDYMDGFTRLMWPATIDEFNPSKFATINGRIADLVKAGALIAMEIDELENMKG